MTDPSIFIHWGDFEAGAVGVTAILALVVICVALIGARWRGLL